MRRSVLSIALAGLVLASTAQADNYGTAGCGLGAMAFKDQPGKIQILAATVNNLVSPQTFAITSGTSNCVEGGNTASAMFIQINEQALRKDISRGGGESVASLSKILNCSDSDMLASALQKNYESIFPNDQVGAEQIGASIQAAIHSNEQLQRSCSAS